jgi:hypothetical protein
MSTIWGNLWSFFSTRANQQAEILHAMITGSSLKSQRDMAGQKRYHLVSLDGDMVTVDKATVELLKKHGLVISNHKFPGATYLMTDKGRDLALTLTQAVYQPIHARVER